MKRKKRKIVPESLLITLNVEQISEFEGHKLRKLLKQVELSDKELSKLIDCASYTRINDVFLAMRLKKILQYYTEKIDFELLKRL
jgi:hypothetical protein